MDTQIITGARLVVEAAHNPEACGRLIAIIAPDMRIARNVLVEGPSGILAVADASNWRARPTWEHGVALVWPNGSRVWLFGADRPHRVRGPEFGLIWAHDVDQSSDIMTFAAPGLRVGTSPRSVHTWSSPKLAEAG